MLPNRSKKRIAAVIAGATVVTAGAVSAASALANDPDDATERPIPAEDLENAEEAALAETGGGEVTDTEVGDEDSFYEFEVTQDDGTQVDVQLDEDFVVVGTEEEGAGEDD